MESFYIFVVINDLNKLFLIMDKRNIPVIDSFDIIKNMDYIFTGRIINSRNFGIGLIKYINYGKE